MGEHPPDAGAREGAGAVLHAHQGEGLQVVPPDHGTEGQLVEQHDLRRCRRQHRLLPRQLHSPARTQLRLDQPVDGSNPATEWKGLLSVDETPHLLNPKSGWLYNTNNWPWSAAGPSSPKKEDYPAYVETAANPRAGCTPSACWRTRRISRSTRSSPRRTTATSRGLRSRMPALIKAWDQTAASNPLKAKLARADRAAARVGSALGGRLRSHFAGGVLGRGCPAARVGGGATGGPSADDGIGKAPADQLLQSLAAASDRLAADFGNWKTPWGDINRFQRLTGDIVQPFNDAAAEHSRRVHLGARGARSPHSARAPTRGRRSGTAPAATASSPWSSSATTRARQGGDRRRRERQSGVPALQRPGQALQPRATCGRCTSTARN